MRENLPLVHHLVKRFQDRGREYDDLFQYGCLGLLKAIDRFDPALARPFQPTPCRSSSARYGAFCAMTAASMWRAPSRKTPAALRKRGRNSCRGRGGNRPWTNFARRCALHREDVLLALNARQGVRSLDAAVDAEGETHAQGHAGHGLHGSGRKKAPAREPFEDAAQGGDAPHRHALFQRRTQTDIAKELGISQVQVSRMESRILKRLRQYAENGL